MLQHVLWKNVSSYSSLPRLEESLWKLLFIHMVCYQFMFVFSVPPKRGHGQFLQKFCLLLQEADAAILGLSTRQALVKLRDQLRSLLEQHQRSAHRQASLQVQMHFYIFYVSGAHIYCWRGLPRWVCMAKVRLYWFLRGKVLLQGGKINISIIIISYTRGCSTPSVSWSHPGYTLNLVLLCFYRKSGWIAFSTMATVTPAFTGREVRSLYWWCWDSSVAMAASQRAGKWGRLCSTEVRESVKSAAARALLSSLVWL